VPCRSASVHHPALVELTVAWSGEQVDGPLAGRRVDGGGEEVEQIQEELVEAVGSEKNEIVELLVVQYAWDVRKVMQYMSIRDVLYSLHC